MAGWASFSVTGVLQVELVSDSWAGSLDECALDPRCPPASTCPPPPSEHPEVPLKVPGERLAAWRGAAVLSRARLQARQVAPAHPGRGARRPPGLSR